MASDNKYTEIQRFIGDLEQCMKCGFCTFVCPVYQEERIETSVARGKNMMIRALLRGELDFSGEFARQLSMCTLCMACTTNCPAKAQIVPVIIAARADKVRARGVGLLQNIIYRILIPRRKLFGYVLRVASWFQKIFMPKTRGSIRHLPFFLSAMGKGRQIPSIAPKFLRQMVPVVNRPSYDFEYKMKVGYFAGCMTEFVYPEVGVKIIDFLTRHGVEVVVPRKQGCCGAPVYMGAGDFKTGRKLADANVKAFEEFDYVITSCATCASSLHSYIKYLADSPEREESYGKFANKIKDITEFLVDILKLPASAYKAVPEVKGKKVTWHDPCHLNRYLGVTQQPRQILKSISEIEYIEMPNADRCCGMAGEFSMSFYDLSQKIADKKVIGIDATRADIVVSACPGCIIQLIDSTTRNNRSVEVMHIMELLD